MEVLTLGAAMTCLASLRLKRGRIQFSEVERLDASDPILLHGGNRSIGVGGPSMKTLLPTGGVAASGSSSRSAQIALLVAGAFFMENLDGTVVVTAMPQMASAFGVHPIDLNIGVSAYLLTLAVFIPASGWVADRFGARRVFAGAIAVFTIASILCGFSENLTAFTIARIMQGIGGAMMVPVGRLAVLRSTEKYELIGAIATITWPGLAAPVLGPALGGFITTYASWHWIFFLNVPLGLIAF